jgi:hypothetical protein
MYYSCTAGLCQVEADRIHSLLRVAVCGKCHKASEEAIFHNSARIYQLIYHLVI